MPGATTPADAIETTLKKVLSVSKHKGRDLDENVASSAQRLLQQSVEFVPAKRPFSQFSSLKAKYILLKPDKNDTGNTSQNKSQVSTGLKQLKLNTEAAVNRQDSANMDEKLGSPRIVLYPPERLHMKWLPGIRIGGGLINIGNTCFMNSILQCLTHTPPFVNYLMSDDHRRKCKQQGFCPMCMMRQHIKTAIQFSGSCFKPFGVLQKMKFIAKHFRFGRQEDAHEFLRLLLDVLQRSGVEGHEKLDRLSKLTTVIHQIFSGFLRSQVQCMQCSARSNTYETFMDISLNLKDVSTLENALAKFFKSETLSQNNAYACERCRQKTKATKKFSLHKTPCVLTIQLNRFGFSRMSGKVTRHVQFPGTLDVRPYMSHRRGEAENYQLYAVLIHSGHSCNMGHYYCYVLGPNGIWHIMNDTTVHPVSVSRVFESQAYLLFYMKTTPSRQTAPKTPLTASPSTPNGLCSSSKLNHALGRHRVAGSLSSMSQDSSTTASSASASGSNVSMGSDVGVPVSRQMVSPTKAKRNLFFTDFNESRPSTASVPSSENLSSACSMARVNLQKGMKEQNGWSKSNGDNDDKGMNGTKRAYDPKLLKELLKKKKMKRKEMSQKHVLMKQKKTFNESETLMAKLSHIPDEKRERGDSTSEMPVTLMPDHVEKMVTEKSGGACMNGTSKLDMHPLFGSPVDMPHHFGRSVDLPPKPKKENGLSLHIPGLDETPKMKKNHSMSDGENNTLSGKRKKLKKQHSDLLNVSVNGRPEMAHVNSSPAAHNIWHVHDFFSGPSPSLGSPQNSTPCTAEKRRKKKKARKERKLLQQQLLNNSSQQSASSSNGKSQSPQSPKKAKKSKRKSLPAKTHTDGSPTKKEKKRLSLPSRAHWEENKAKKKRKPVSDDADTSAEDSSSSNRKKRKRPKHSTVADTDDDTYIPARKSLKLSRSQDMIIEAPAERKIAQPSSNRPVAVHRWDDYVKDSVVKRKGQDLAPRNPTALSWDGSRKSEVVEQLYKRTAVTTWGGEKSEAEIEAEREEKRRKKKSWKDHYEEELDQGKVKKLKQKAEDNHWTFNFFQRYQNHKNNEKYRWDDDLGSGHRTHFFPDRGSSMLNHSDNAQIFSRPQQNGVCHSNSKTNLLSEHSHSGQHFISGQHLPTLSRSFTSL